MAEVNSFYLKRVIDTRRKFPNNKEKNNNPPFHALFKYFCFIYYIDAKILDSNWKEECGKC